MSRHPVLLVHGLWNTRGNFRRLRRKLAEEGFGAVRAMDLCPNDGRARIETLASQVDREAAELLRQSGAERLDVVGFSMGALVSRYWLQRMAGKECTRRFVSICGPHHGTLTAWSLPREGVKQMRPNSELLRELHSEEDPFGEVDVHVMWTPFDLMIVPPRSARLPHAREEHRLALPLHRFMITHPRALERVTSILSQP